MTTHHPSAPAAPAAPAARIVRKDARRNRTLLLAAADALVRERGMDLSLNAVAHHAGVGVGTVYRHFPDRDALVTAMFGERVDTVAAILTGHERDEDPVDGLRAAVLEICEMQVGDRGVWAVVAAGNRSRHRTMVQSRVLPPAQRLVARANATGRLRSRFETTDLPVLWWTGGALNAHLGGVSAAAWRRYVQLMLDSYLRDDDPARRSVEQRALTLDEIDAVMSTSTPSATRPGR